MPDDPKCEISVPCKVETPWGVGTGKKCKLGKEINRLVNLKKFKRFVNQKVIYPSPDAHQRVSMSSCPTQDWGGAIRLVIDTKQVKDQVQPMCYYDHLNPTKENDRIEEKMRQEELFWRKRGVNEPEDYVTAKYGFSSPIFTDECEYQSFVPIPREAVKRVEVWLGGERPEGRGISCIGIRNPIVGSLTGADGYIKFLKEIREGAKRLDIPFQVKSCYKMMHPKGVDEQLDAFETYEVIPLTPENLTLLGEGTLPKTVSSDTIKTHELHYPCDC